MRFDDRTIPRGLLFFWAAWLSLVTLTNVLDGLKSLRMMPTGWAFASGNYAFMASVTAKYGTPTAVTAMLFVGVVAWELLAAVLFWRAFAAHRADAATAGDAVRQAFTVSLALWAAFMLADEVFFAFDAEGTHVHLLIAQLASLLTILWLARSGFDAPATISADTRVAER
jgi:predicted anti-sigma-YlaC factor YlaD